jgi:1-acyl-sn-glycerol-3-phosphate acyltransferase
LLSRIFLPLFGSMEVVGRENLPRHGPLLIAANHQSDSDPAVLVYAVDRPIWFMAKRGLFAGPIASYLLRSVHVYPVARDGRDIAALRWAQEQLDHDRALLIFPEGTRNPGALAAGTDGMAYIALRTGAPVVPIAITGTEQIPRMIRTPFHFRKLKAVIGEPIHLPTSQGRIDREMLHSMTHRVMEGIAALLPEEYRGYYAESLRAQPTPEATAEEAPEETPKDTPGTTP